MGMRILSSDEITSRIEELVVAKNLSFLEATTHFCELTGMEVEAVAEVIRRSPRIRSKIQIIAEDLNMIKRDEKGRLDF